MHSVTKKSEKVIKTGLMVLYPFLVIPMKRFNKWFVTCCNVVLCMYKDILVICNHCTLYNFAYEQDRYRKQLCNWMFLPVESDANYFRTTT